jgi:hypothetical protein
MKLTQTVFNMEETRTERNDNALKVTGYAARFEKLSVPMFGFKEKIRAGAFSKSLKTNNIKALWNHNSDLVLGSTSAGTLSLEEDDKGLRFEMTLPDTQAGRDAHVLVERGDVNQMSFGFLIKKQEWDEADRSNVIRTLVEVDLREVSLTPFPAYKQTSAKTRSVNEDYEDYRKEINAEQVKETSTRKNELDIKMKLLSLED